MKTIRRISRDVPQHWVGDGFPVRSLFSYAEGNEFDPFLLLDYAGPHHFDPATDKRGVDEHPHRGFETVTIVYQGELMHRDSAGNQGTIGPGDVQWMTAASGVVHEEYHSDEFTNAGGVLEMVQLWVNLPAEEKMSPPRYQEILNAQIPSVRLPNDAGSVRVIAGQCAETNGPAQTVTPINIWDVQLLSGRKTELTLPVGFTTLLIVQQGAVKVNQDETVKAVELIEFDREGAMISLAADEDAKILILSGEPIREPVVGQGPFVMNSRDEILQAIDDFRHGKMGRLQ